MNILNLPNDIWLFLFNSKFSLQELFHLRGICHHICSLIESSHCIGSRKILKIFWSFKDIPSYTLRWYHYSLEDIDELKLKEIGSKDDDLVLNPCEFSESTCDLLVRLFPRVHHLMVYFTEQKQYPDYLILSHLFSAWTVQLTGLSLVGIFVHSSMALENSIEQNCVARLNFCSAINQLATLKHFDMCLSNLFQNEYSINIRNIEQTKLLLPAKLDQILPRLERLYFHHKSLNFSQNIVGHLGAGCTRLCLQYLDLPKGELREALDQKLVTYGTAGKLTHLKLTQDFQFVLSDIYGHTNLSALESLTLSQAKAVGHGNDPLDTILSKLVPLKRLTNLKMMNFDFTILQYPSIVGRVPVLSQIICFSILLSNHELEDPFALFTGLAHIFPFVANFTLHLTRTLLITFKEPIQLNWIQFPMCTQFRLLTQNTNNWAGTFTPVLSRHFRGRFEHECSSDDTTKYDTMQQWRRCGLNAQWVESK